MNSAVIQGTRPPSLAATRADWDGFAGFELRSRDVAVTVVPELGAKVVSLRNLHTGREWMSFPGSFRKLFRNSPHDDFAHSPVAGWDECLPTIARCEWRGRALPDHGEVWGVPWTLAAAAWEQQRITTTIQPPGSPFRFSRTIAVQGGLVRVSYRLANHSAEPQEFLWAMHPLLALQPGDRLELPPEAAACRARYPWLASLNFDDQAAQCGKVFIGPLREGCVALYNAATRDRLTFEWTSDTMNQLGIWLTRGGWNGHHHLALEPTNARCDSLAQMARDDRNCPTIRAGSRLEWTIHLHVEPAS